MEELSWDHIEYQEKQQVSGRLLMIFSYKALIYTVISGVIGLIFFFLFKSVGLSKVGIVFIVIFALIGFAIGTFKVPEIDTFEITRKTGGQNIDDVLKQLIKFKMKKKKIYTYAKEEKENE